MEENQWNRVYLNSAKHFKVGKNLWVDRLFSNAVMNGCIASMHQQLPTQNSGTIVSGPHRMLGARKSQDVKFGKHLFRSQYGW